MKEKKISKTQEDIMHCTDKAYMHDKIKKSKRRKEI